MAVSAPASATPGLSLLEWNETAVNSWLMNLGLGQYESLIHEQGITGDVLCVMDQPALQDLGVTSVGHRLNLLRAVWQLKQEQGIELGEDDWRPQDDVSVKPVSPADVDRLEDMIRLQQERIYLLERNHSQLLSKLEEVGVAIPSLSPADSSGLLDTSPEKGQLVNNANYGDWRRDISGTRSDGDDPTSAASRARRRAPQFPPPAVGASSRSGAPLSGSATTFASVSERHAGSPRLHDSSSIFDSHLQPAKLSAPPPLQRLMSGSELLGASSGTPTSSLGTNGKISLGASTSSQIGPTSLPSIDAALQGADSSRISEDDRAQAKDAARSAAKSFRVTLEDPCYKVLPAALKKYKIVDDWRKYALFIQAGEGPNESSRCLAYDEKPLLMFQKLKENGQKPVFMLRNIKDIKPPVQVANAKQAEKLGLSPDTTTNLLPRLKPRTDSSNSPSKATSLTPSSRDKDGSTPSGGTFPELSSPGLKDGEGPGHTALKRTFVDKDGNVVNLTYAVAIYPYIADRQDEFDVAVGMVFVIFTKTKGWYIVQHDPDGLGNIVFDSAKSGWVPAGCLLELSTPISIASPDIKPDALPPFPGLMPCPTSVIMSSSYLGHVFANYEKKADDQISLREGEQVKVYKKYSDWGYTVKLDTGERGWVPAWIIGKLSASSSGGNEPSPATAATLGISEKGPSVANHAGQHGGAQGEAGDGRLEKLV